MALRIDGDEDDTFEVQDTDLVTDGDPEVVYTIRRLSLPRTRQLFETHKRKKRNGDVDVLEVNDDQLDYILVGWKGIVDRDGKELPCTRETKLGDLKQGLRGLPGPRRRRLIELAENAERVAEEAKQKSFREPADVRGV
jgi:hypothetical protein